MKKSDIKVLPEYFGNYINEVEDIELSEALKLLGPNLLASDNEKLISLGEKVYAPGKWSVKDIIQHLIDCERIFNYRALTIARNDKTEIPGFEENDYAKVSNANARTIDDLVEEFQTIRSSTINLFNSFDKEMLLREGTCNNKKISVLALGFVLPGHVIHHTNVIKEKYFPLLIS